MNVKILVCCHKKTELPFDEDFLPIHAGKALSDVDLGMVGDDTGDNISGLNPYFCELTAQYWAWKNLKDVDVIGLCHYRRFFKLSGGVGRTYRQKRVDRKDIDTSLIPMLLNGYDVILPKPIITGKAIYDLFSAYMTEVQMQIYLRLFFLMHPEYKNVMVDYLNGNRYIGCNMAIMPWRLFCRYNEFLFGFLFKAREYIKPLPYSYYNRSFGMFSEILLPVFCKVNNLKERHVPMIILLGTSEVGRKPIISMFPKFLTTKVNDAICNAKYFVVSRKCDDNCTPTFWNQYLVKDGIII